MCQRPWLPGREQAATGSGPAVPPGASRRWHRLPTKSVFRSAIFRGHPRQPFRPQLWPQRKKLVPARNASHSRQFQPPSQHRQHSCNFLRRDSLQLQVAADPASRIKKIPQRYGSRVKAYLTGAATPRNDTHSAEQIIGSGPPPRSPASRGLTPRAVHRKILEGPLRMRIGDAPLFGKRLSPRSQLTT